MEHKLFGRHFLEVALVLLKVEECSPLVLAALAYEKHDTMALVRYQGTHLFDSRRTRTLKDDSGGNFLDDVFEPHPFAINVEWLQFVVLWIRRNRDNVQAGIQCWWGDALVR